MKIETIDVAGFMPALRAMRNPMDSWEKSDTAWDKVGEKDKGLSKKLQSAGSEHCKHLRMIIVWADITAPRYWWNEFDTYRIGVEKVSCSTMHTLMKRELVLDDFELYGEEWDSHIVDIVGVINGMMTTWRETEDPEKKKQIWIEIIRILPQSFLQKRTVMMSYAALRNIYRQREGHKLNEWHIFRDWVESLPESWMITE